MRKKGGKAAGPPSSGPSQEGEGRRGLGQKKKSNLVFKIKTFPFLVFKSQANFQTKSNRVLNILFISERSEKILLSLQK